MYHHLLDVRGFQDAYRGFGDHGLASCHRRLIRESENHGIREREIRCRWQTQHQGQKK